jgi:DNA-binding beta-propeller fold protein YncE
MDMHSSACPPVGNEPFGIAITPNGKAAYVTGRTDSVTPIRTATNTAGPPITVGNAQVPSRSPDQAGGRAAPSHIT